MLRRLALAALLALAPSLASAQLATIGPTPVTSDNGDRLATTAWVNNFFNLGIPLASGKIFIGSAGGIATAQSLSQDCTLVASGVITCTQSAGAFTVNGLLTVTSNLSVGGSIIDGSGILATNIVAPATPAAGTTRLYVDSTSKVLSFKNDAGTVGNAMVPSTCAANQFGTSISAAGVFGCAQPAVANISGLGTGVAGAAANNLSAAGGLTTTIASGATALATGTISSATCATAVTATATNTATTDVVTASFNGDPTAVTGYVPLTTGMLTIFVYPSANNVNFKVCNGTSGSITPGAITLNWRVVR